MHIFIDESGGFQRNQAKPHSISCVGAAIVPGRNLGELERGFQILSKEWPRTEAGEIKGRLLHEHHVVALCNLLMQLDVIFEASVMDMNVSDDADIDYHKSMQAKGMTINLTRDHDLDFVRNVWELRRLLEKMSKQLYAQAVALADVVWSAFQDGQLYFCQRLPGELARFHWVIDAKDKKRITDYEEWWRQCIMPLVQSRSLRKPLVFLKGGEYSAFRRNFPSRPMPQYLRPKADDPAEWVAELNGIFGREMEFATSETHIGLIVADILTNALRRGLSDRLQPEGWRPLGKLLIRNRNGAIRLITLGRDSGALRAAYANVIHQLNQDGRSMVKKKSKPLR